MSTCGWPSVAISNGSATVDDAYVGHFETTQTIAFGAMQTFYCPTGNISNRYWTLSSNPPTNQNFPNVSGPFFRAKASQLQCGAVYKLSYILEFYSKLGDGGSLARVTRSVQIVITRSPVAPVLFYRQSTITVMDNASLVLDIGLSTFDPNEAGGQFLTSLYSFAWTCSASAVQGAAPGVNADCSKIGLAGSTATLTGGLTAYFHYNITVAMTSQYDTNTHVSSSLIVNVLPASANIPTLIIGCRNTYFCQNATEGYRINSASAVVFDVRTWTGSAVQLSQGARIQWKIRSDGSDMGAGYISRQNLLSVQINPQALFIARPYPSVFTLTATVTPDENTQDQSYSEVVFVENTPPFGGSCTSAASQDPMTGQPMLNVSCTGWQDSDGIGLYRYFVNLTNSPSSDRALAITAFASILTYIPSVAVGYQSVLYVGISDTLHAETVVMVGDLSNLTDQCNFAKDLFHASAAQWQDAPTAVTGVVQKLKWEANADNTLIYANNLAAFAASNKGHLPPMSRTLFCSCAHRFVDCKDVAKQNCTDQHPMCEEKELISNTAQVLNNITDAMAALSIGLIPLIGPVADTLNALITPMNVTLVAQQNIATLWAHFDSVLQTDLLSYSNDQIQSVSAKLLLLSTTLTRVFRSGIFNTSRRYDSDYHFAHSRYLSEYTTNLARYPKPNEYPELMTKDELRSFSFDKYQRQSTKETVQHVGSCFDSAATMLAVSQLSDTNMSTNSSSFFVTSNTFENFTSPQTHVAGTTTYTISLPPHDQQQMFLKALHYDTNIHLYTLNSSANDSLLASHDLSYNKFDTSTSLKTSTPLAEIRNMSKPVVVTFSTSPQAALPIDTSQLNPNFQMFTHTIAIDGPSLAVRIEIMKTRPGANLQLFLAWNAPPATTSYNLTKSFPTDQVNLSWFLSDEDLNQNVTGNTTGTLYLGVAELIASCPTTNPAPKQGRIGGIPPPIFTDTSSGQSYCITSTYSTNYNLLIQKPSCVFLDGDSWNTHGCHVSNLTNSSTAVCTCNHLSIFSSKFVFAPEGINFAYAMSHASIGQNMTIYTTLFFIYLLYLTLLLWARRRDRTDRKKLALIPLPDNHPAHMFIYEINVITGARPEAATDSNVYFVLNGTEGSSSMRKFATYIKNKKLFRRGAVDRFLVTMPSCLGELQSIDVWHDNTGGGKFASWFLSKITVKDIIGRKSYSFRCSDWLAVEHGDGETKRRLFVFVEESDVRKETYSAVLQNKLKGFIHDEHLWFSVFLRPAVSRFTCCQRVTCAITMLLLSMLIEAMFYNEEDEKNKGDELDIGPFKVSPKEVWVALIGSSIIIPVSHILIPMFRRARYHEKRKSEVEKALRRMHHFHVENYPPRDETKDQEELEPRSRRMPCGKKEEPFLLPWWFRHVGWALCFVGMITCTYMIFARAVTMGDLTTRKWMSAMVMGTFSDITLHEPAKAILMALIISMLCRELDDEEAQLRYDEEEFRLLCTEEALRSVAPSAYLQPKIPVESVELTEERAEKRKKENRLFDGIRETIFFVIYFTILLIVAYGTRSSYTYILRTHVATRFLHLGAAEDDFMKINTSTDFWRWSEHVLAHQLIASRWYEPNNSAGIGQRGLIADRTNRLIGYAVLRQARIRHGMQSCKGSPFASIFGFCNGESMLTHEDRKNYDVSWKPLGNVSRPEYQYVYRTSGVAYTGRIDTYISGGYALALVGNRSDLTDRFKLLHDEGWIDRRTRAIFVEFSTYNAPVNLFVNAKFVLEMPPYGSLIPSYKVSSLRLLRAAYGYDLFLLIVEYTFIGYTFLFFVKECRNIYKQKPRVYFTQFWNLLEIGTVALSFGAIGVYAARAYAIDSALELFNKTKGNDYVNIDLPAYQQRLFTTLISVVLFLTTLKLIRQLRFGSKMQLMISTIKNSFTQMANASFVFILLYFAFTATFTLAFGTQLAEYMSISSSFITNLQFFLLSSQFCLKALKDANGFLGPIFTSLFAFFVIMILSNIFATIFIRIFEIVRNDRSKQGHEPKVFQYLLEKCRMYISGKTVVGAERNCTMPDCRFDQMMYNQLEAKTALLLSTIDLLYVKLRHVDAPTPNTLESTEAGTAGQQMTSQEL